MAEAEQDQEPELSPATRRTLTALLAQIRFERWLMLITLGAIGALAYVIYRHERDRERALNGYGRTLGAASMQQPINIYNYLPAPAAASASSMPKTKPNEASPSPSYYDQDENWS